MSIRGSAMVRPEVQEREDGALQVRGANTDSFLSNCSARLFANAPWE